jgi:hypothetical protein
VRVYLQLLSSSLKPFSLPTSPGISSSCENENEERISRPVCRLVGRIDPSYLIEVNEGLPNHADGVLEVLLRDD